MENRLYITSKWLSARFLTLKFHSLGEIYNYTYDCGEETSRIEISDTPEQAHFSKEGKDMKDPDWDLIEKEIDDRSFGLIESGKMSSGTCKDTRVIYDFPTSILEKIKIWIGRKESFKPFEFW